MCFCVYKYLNLVNAVTAVNSVLFSTRSVKNSDTTLDYCRLNNQGLPIMCFNGDRNQCKLVDSLYAPVFELHHSEVKMLNIRSLHDWLHCGLLQPFIAVHICHVNSGFQHAAQHWTLLWTAAQACQFFICFKPQVFRSAHKKRETEKSKWNASLKSWLLNPQQLLSELVHIN